ncbi:hypothetical protein Aduo_005098 [Ancylostoma duodenale]
MLLSALLPLLLVEADDFLPRLPPETPVDNTRGYELHDFQLIRPYSNAPHWDLYGDAFISRNKIRLTREAQSLNGSIWSRNRVSARDWEIQVDLRIYAGSAPPADGVAIWYLEQPAYGSAWGGPTNFSGIGVVLDTYTNAIGGMSTRQSTRLFVILNTRSHATVVDPTIDGNNLRIEGECDLGNDLISSRVPTSYEHSPTIRILIRYVHEELEVFYAVPARDHEHWQMCMNASGLFLPINYYLGVSAATGELKSTHELLSFRIYQLDTPPHYIENPVKEPMYIGMYAETSGTQEYSFWSSFFYFVEVVIVVALMLVVLYGLYYVTDKYIDDSFLMARPRRRFY